MGLILDTGRGRSRSHRGLYQCVPGTIRRTPSVKAGITSEKVLDLTICLEEENGIS